MMQPALSHLGYVMNLSQIPPPSRSSMMSGFDLFIICTIGLLYYRSCRITLGVVKEISLRSEGLVAGGMVVAPAGSAFCCSHEQQCRRFPHVLHVTAGGSRVAPLVLKALKKDIADSRYMPDGYLSIAIPAWADCGNLFRSNSNEMCPAGKEWSYAAGCINYCSNSTMCRITATTEDLIREASLRMPSRSVRASWNGQFTRGSSELED